MAHVPPPTDDLLDRLQRAAFDYFVEATNPANGLVADTSREDSPVSIAVVGKYAEHRDAYKSIYEAIDHAGVHFQTQVRVGRIQSEDVEREGPERLLAGYDGILVPGGFGERGIAGKVEAIRFARERQVPFFGICLGMQCAVIEFARNVVGLVWTMLRGLGIRAVGSGEVGDQEPIIDFAVQLTLQFLEGKAGAPVAR